MTKLKTCIIVILSILSAITSFQAIYPRFSHRMEYVIPNDIIYVSYIDIDYNYSKQDIRLRLESITGIKYYFYTEKSLKNNIMGYTNITLRHITIDSNISNNEYIEVLCHELLHLKYNTGNERFTQYKTFVTLYNSEFKQIANNIVNKMYNGYYHYDYNCYAQIIEYLNINS